MITVIKRAAKRILDRICLSWGYELNRITGDFGQNAFRDMRKITKAIRDPIVFDAGANEGQTTRNFRNHFDHPVIHAFEPGDAFSKLGN